MSSGETLEEPSNSTLTLLTARPSRKLQLAEQSAPFANVSFSRSGEDLLIRHVFKWAMARGELGTYVDIGCGSPFEISNSYLFYCYGWRGLCVDANNHWEKAWRKYRPEDVFVNTALGEQEGSGYLFKSKVNVGMAEVSNASTPPDETFFPEPQAVPIVRLDSLFAKFIGDKKIQFMSIDVEGAELSILKSNDWNQWRPEAILFECLGSKADAPYDHPIAFFLRNLGYKPHSRIFGNVLFVDAHM